MFYFNHPKYLIYEKSSYKKTTAFLSFALMTSILTAQDLDLQTPVTKLSDQIKGIFPYVAGVIFLIVVMVNLGHFVKENGDWKKGLMNIIIYVVIVGVVAGLFQFITRIRL